MSQPQVHRIPVSGGQSIVLDWIPPAPRRPSALFVHGFGSHRRGEKSLYFAQRFAALGWGYAALDFRGHGESGGSLADLTLTGLLEDLAAVLDWLGARGGPPFLIGSSMGAAVCAWHVRVHPRSAKGLILIAPSLRFPAGLIASLGEEELAAWRREGKRRFRNAWLDVEVGYDLVRDAARYDPALLLRDHALPSLLFHGLSDEAVPWRQSLEFLEQCPFPSLRLVLIKDGDHRLTAHKAFLFETLSVWCEEILI